MSTTHPEVAPGAYFEQLGVSPELMRRVMDAALSRGGDDCDLYFQHSAATSVSMSDHKVNMIGTHVDLGMGVRVVVGDQVGYAYSEDLDPEALCAAARAAAEIARGTPGKTAAFLRMRPVPNLYPELLPWGEVGVDARVKLLQDWEARAFAKDARIRRVEGSLSDGARRVLIARPDGRLFEDTRPMASASLRCTAVDGELRESAGHNLAGRAGFELFAPEAVERLIDQAVSRTVFLLTAGKPPAGEMPVVLAAGPSAILLHEAIGHGMEADFNRKRTSIYADKMGLRIANEHVTVVDDGTLPGTRGAVNVDDEGNLSQRTVLVENGVLRSYLHDEISARHYGVAPTGSGRRQDFRSAPLPRMRATVMEPGPHAPEEIIRSVEKGIYCVSFANGQVNIGGGDFSFYMRHGYLIEGGKLTRPIKDVNIIGNGPEALANMDMIGDDLVLDDGGWTCGKDGQSVPVSQGMPTVRVKSLSVGGVG